MSEFAEQAGERAAQALGLGRVVFPWRCFGVQVGCGIDHKTYAMAYAKNFPKPAIGCAVIIDGFQPITIPMDLGTR